MERDKTHERTSTTLNKEDGSLLWFNASDDNANVSFDNPENILKWKW